MPLRSLYKNTDEILYDLGPHKKDNDNKHYILHTAISVSLKICTRFAGLFILLFWFAEMTIYCSKPAHAFSHRNTYMLCVHCEKTQIPNESSTWCGKSSQSTKEGVSVMC